MKGCLQAHNRAGPTRRTQSVFAPALRSSPARQQGRSALMQLQGRWWDIEQQPGDGMPVPGPVGGAAGPLQQAGARFLAEPHLPHRFQPAGSPPQIQGTGTEHPSDSCFPYHLTARTIASAASTPRSDSSSWCRAGRGGFHLRQLRKRRPSSATLANGCGCCVNSSVRRPDPGLPPAPRNCAEPSGRPREKPSMVSGSKLRRSSVARRKLGGGFDQQGYGA